MRIGVVGLWHLGEVVSSCLAELGHTVTAYDPDPAVIEKFRRGEPVLAEPDIRELMAKNKKAGRLSYEIFSPDAVKLHDIFFITFDTPIKKDDSPDTGIIEKTVEEIAKNARPGLLIIVMSQLPVGTMQTLKEKIRKICRRDDIKICHVPENLQLGRAVESFMKPARIIIGAEPKDAELVKKIFEKLPGEKIIMSPASAEMAKHALNSFLATSLSFIYNIADICEAVGADVVAVSLALKSDPRIGAAAYLDASLGFSGGTLMRDMRVLEAKAKQHKMAVPVISGAINTNTKRLTRAVTILKKNLRSLRGKKVTIIGLTYKPGTPTLRASLAILLMNLLRAQGMIVSGSDPAASCGEVRKVTQSRCEKDPYRAASGSAVVIMITSWPEYASLDPRRLKRAMKPPFLFLDARNFLASRAKEFKNLGFRYQGIGRGSIDI
ncbi:MAG: hypothetical protein A3C11_02585 [Candidatus Sungbacteria bacterium RIFCSPHIGHO2_02_FULL_49_12]|uniref:UDP-glucose 6-dehydrogenase n=1 Tax=Candidatus Sungbacteria bacterium RIFCSPHIGHO2_02_FULL_49_12 TaxID=1802271 RepID=A0A1G2KMR0_9BACT|nr:MAG: hypothetical protein A3C11_02585 [Candidatus Sungbacteria bacterium RIFCSPHIGHO2_02_FULL_49_12]